MRPGPTPARTVLLLFLLAGCAAPAAQAAGQSHPSDCRTPGKAVLPRTIGTLTEGDNGARICLAPDQEIAVLLSAGTADPGRHWKTITVTPATGVKHGNSGMMTLPVGTTAGLFIPTAPGRFELNSSQGAGPSWQVTLVVR